MSNTPAVDANAQPTTPHKRKHYSTPKQVQARYGGRSAMWLWRLRKTDPAFPKPDVMGLYDDDELDSYDQAKKEAAARAREEAAA